MPDITITEFAEALRGEMRADMRVHRIEVESALRDVQAEVRDGRVEQRRQHSELVALVAQLNDTVNSQAGTVNELAETRATWTRRVQVIVRSIRWMFNSGPGLATTALSAAGMVAGAIALF